MGRETRAQAEKFKAGKDSKTEEAASQAQGPEFKPWYQKPNKQQQQKPEEAGMTERKTESRPVGVSVACCLYHCDKSHPRRGEVSGGEKGPGVSCEALRLASWRKHSSGEYVSDVPPGLVLPNPVLA